MTAVSDAPVAERGESLGGRMHTFLTELYPICRSITGDGLRATLLRIGAQIPLTLSEVPTGTPVLDWTVPNEWNIREAWIADRSGRRVVDFRRHSLHVVNYSAPMQARMPLAELRPHLHTLPEHPAWIPYRTSYYRETWGFCPTHEQLLALPDDEYDVHIDSTLAPGSLTYGECVLPGEHSDEILFSCHCCHPSLANDNLAGIAVAIAHAAWLADRPRRYTYRFLFIPGTIGSITWLARNGDAVRRIRGGLVLSCLGDAGVPHYKRSRRGDAVIDRAVGHVLRHAGPHAIRDFDPYGYDERQYCSPGYDLAVGCFTRTPNGRYAEYHTSADDPQFVRAESLSDSLMLLQRVVEVLEDDLPYRNLSPFGEPQLGRRGLYRPTGGVDLPEREFSLLWVLNQSDGHHSLLEIAERSGLSFAAIVDAARALEAVGLLDRPEVSP